MSNPTQKKNGKYLWFTLLGLGFHPDIATSIAGKASIHVKHVNVGPNMFDKPNKDAFYIVIHFLLEKLNPTRFHETYRHCWSAVNHKADAEFRKVTCAWLREIMDETANAGSKVLASLFLSPGGPKFISLMLHLATHVMLQEMKTFTADDSWVPEAAAKPASTSDIAAKRLDLIRVRFLKAAVDQDRFLHEYQRRAQLLVKSMRDIKADGAKYDELLTKCRSSGSTQDGALPVEKIKKVRALWSAVDEMLSTIKEEQNAVESVMKGDVDQYILNGTDRVLKVPRCLLDRIEQLPHQLSSGNVYEAGQLNLLCVMELMNHALQLLREEQCRVSHAPKPAINPQHLQDKCRQMARMLQDLHLIRQKISKEEIPEVRNAIRELEADWDKKWMDTLRVMPLMSFLNEDPALGFLSPMAPLSFEPAAEASYRSSVFSQYPAKLLEEKSAESKSQEDVHPSYSNVTSPYPATVERTQSPVVTTEASQTNTSLHWLFDTHSPLSAPPVPPPQASARKTTHVHRKVAPTRTKTLILDMECDNLADQFADAVTTTTPSEGRVKGLDLEGLLGTLQRDPFSTKKQLPRTPECLIMDVKSSWRKAVKEDEARKIRQSAEANGRTTKRPSPVGEPRKALPSPDAPSQTVSGRVPSHSSPPVVQRGLLFESMPSWDTFNAETVDGLSGTGGSAVQFSLEHETLPEMLSWDSLSSLDDDYGDVKSEEDELLIPSLKTDTKQTRSTARRHLGQNQPACNDGSPLGLINAPECRVPVSASGRDRRTEPATSVEAAEKVFSLDLDELEGCSPRRKQEYSLPSLITFSPIDDMKR
ncbi:HAUS augmin-like complex subunit 6 [Embiotoca jacksoni]|uniref:HAUS augmin-like complex subunit 6 n=1 Tax=Embiotoca jacksoni TaxID=100190 RepID=UPI003703F7DD